MGWEDGLLGYMFGHSDGVAEGKRIAEREAAASAGNSGGGSGPNKDLLAQIAVAWAGVECGAITLLTLGVVSQTGISPPLQAALTIAAAVPLMALYLAMHGSWYTMLLAAATLTPIWTAAVYVWENPFARIHGQFLDTCATFNQCVQHVFPSRHIAWGWTLCALFASIFLRMLVYVYIVRREGHSISVFDPVVRTSLLTRTWMWLRRLGVSVLIATALGVVTIVVIKACSSEDHPPLDKVHRKHEAH